MSIVIKYVIIKISIVQCFKDYIKPWQSYRNDYFRIPFTNFEACIFFKVGGAMVKNWLEPEIKPSSNISLFKWLKLKIYQLLNTFASNSSVLRHIYFLAFPAWEPGSQDVLCAKFLYFYEPRCFILHEQALKSKIRPLKGKKRLQGNSRFLNLYYRHGQSVVLQLIFAALGPFYVMRKSNISSTTRNLVKKLSIKTLIKFTHGLLKTCQQTTYHNSFCHNCYEHNFSL